MVVLIVAANDVPECTSLPDAAESDECSMIQTNIYTNLSFVQSASLRTDEEIRSMTREEVGEKSWDFLEGSSFPFFTFNAEKLPVPQLIFTFLIYGAILYFAAGTLSEGAELLLHIPSLSGIVGSVVLPVLGGVPDGMMVLFSGIGPTLKAQNQLDVGMGALSGSTIMLLTIPFFLSIFAGRVTIEDGNCNYKNKPTEGMGCNPLGTGIEFKPLIKTNAILMFITSLPFLVVQIPAAVFDKSVTKDNNTTEIHEIRWEGDEEKAWVLTGFILTILLFIVYMIFNIVSGMSEEGSQTHYHADALYIAQHGVHQFGLGSYVDDFIKSNDLNGKTDDELKKILKTVTLPKDLKSILTYFFKLHAKHDLVIDKKEFQEVLTAIQIRREKSDIDKAFEQVDVDNSGTIELSEFLESFKQLAAMKASHRGSLPAGRIAALKQKSTASINDDEDNGDDEEELPEIPEGWATLSEDEKRHRILALSCFKMLFGTVLVLCFSDPMVDVLNQFGIRSGIPVFYVSFVLAPLASNSSELMSSYTFASRKTKGTITNALCTLLGAACMNNTFSLGIFFGLIYFQDLAWKFTAETISILVSEWLIFILFMVRQSQLTLLEAFFVLAIWPCSIGLTAILENVCGLD